MHLAHDNDAPSNEYQFRAPSASWAFSVCVLCHEKLRNHCVIVNIEERRAYTGEAEMRRHKLREPIHSKNTQPLLFIIIAYQNDRNEFRFLFLFFYHQTLIWISTKAVCSCCSDSSRSISMFILIAYEAMIARFGRSLWPSSLFICLDCM